MKQKQSKQPQETLSFPRSKSAKKYLLIESCQDCHKHQAFCQHDEALFHQLFDSIAAQLQLTGLQHVKIVKNKPFKYLSRLNKKNLPLKNNLAHEKCDHLNEITKQVERFPRLGSFQVYFDNFIVFSMLKSSFKVVTSDQTIERTNEYSGKNNDELNTLQKRSQTFSSITVKTLSQVIVSIVNILCSHSSQVDFLEKVQNIFRFLQLQWKPVNFHQSIVQFMLMNTSTQNFSSAQEILKSFLQLISNPDVKLNGIKSLRLDPKKVMPYTYYKKSEKHTRIRSIYREKSSKKVFLSESRSNRSQNPQQIIKFNIKCQEKKINQCLREQTVKDNKSILMKKVSKEVRESLVNIKQKPQIFTKRYQKQPEKNSMNSSKQQGFIIKKPYKRTSIRKIQNSKQVNQVTEENNSETKKYGFISRNQLVKSKVIQNQVLLDTYKTNALNSETESNLKRQNRYIGKIVSVNGKTQKADSKVQTKENIQSFSQKFFKRTKISQSCNNLNSFRSDSNNLMKNEFLQGRPLSSRPNTKVITKDDSNLKKSNPLSQKQINVSQLKDSNTLKNENEWMYTAKQSNLQIQNDMPNEIILSSLSVKSKSPQPSVSELDKKIPQRKYSKNFVKENIRRVSMTKRVNNYGLSTSFWQKLHPSVEKKGKKSYSSYRGSMSLSREGIQSFKGKLLEKVDQNQVKENLCGKSDSKKSESINLSAKSKSDSMKSSIEKGKSLKSSCSKDSKQNSLSQIEKLQQNFEETKAVQISSTEAKNDTEETPVNNDEEICGQKIQDYKLICQNSVDPEPKDSLHEEQESNANDFNIQNRFSQSDEACKLITYTLGSQQGEESELKKSKLNEYLQSVAYYNHSLFISLQPNVKYEPAYITYQLHYDQALESSKRFASLLKEKNFAELQKLARFSFEKQDIYQQYMTKSLRQIYKMDELNLFPLSTTKSRPQDFFNPEDLRSIYWEQPSLLADIVYLLTIMNRKFISRLFENVKSVNYLGYYGVWLYDLSSNKFELVIVDDEFCVSVGQRCEDTQGKDQEFIFNGLLSQKSVWYMILEKAVAKLLGGYVNIDKCFFSKLFKILTGCQYVEVNDLSPEKISKILSEKIFLNKNTTVYATMSRSKCMENTNLEGYDSCVEKITGWSFNEKNPFLSLVHFQSSRNRIQSLTMMDFHKEFERITLSFFNPNFLFNHKRLERTDQTKEKKYLQKVLEIFSNSCNKENVCYISVSHDKNSPEKENQLCVGSKKSLKTTLKIYRQVSSYDFEKRSNKLGFVGSNQQDDSTQTENQKFRYNGQIQKGGEFFFQVKLKSGRNLCFVESEAQSLNIGFYSQEKLHVKILSQKEVNKVKLVNGEGYSKVDEKINNHINKDNFQSKYMNKNSEKDKKTCFKQKETNKTIRNKWEINQEKIKKQNGQNKKQKKQNRKNLLSQRVASREFLEDKMLQRNKQSMKDSSSRVKNSNQRRRFMID